MKSNTFSAPEWAKRAVWYQIFPERFRNGDPKNDPTINDIEGAYPHDTSSPWQIHPWTADWYELQPYERKNGKDIWFNLQRRRYGGDLQGILDKFDYLQKLGINAIYLTPVFESPSLHKYDATTYHHIDPNFGPDPEWDRKIIASETGHDPTTWKWTSADRLMLHLINEVHRRGMRIIFDGVFNHIGLNHWAFRDVAQRQQASRYRDWFKIQSWHNAKTGESFKYQGWWSLKELPEWQQDENGIVAGPRDYIFAITKRWMDPNGDGNPGDGVDGWRLDATKDVSPKFWREWCAYARRLNPEVYLSAEIWSEAPEWISNEMFNSIMNYPFAYATMKFFINQRRATLLPGEFQAELLRLLKVYPESVNLGLMNLVNTHDTDRLANMIRNPDLDYDQKRSPRYNPAYDPAKPSAADVKTQKMIITFQAAFPGAPMIFYGDEAGMWGGDDPDCRKPMIWPEFEYETETYEGIGRNDKPGAVAFDHDLHQHYRRLMRLRRNHPALRLGTFAPLLVDDARRLFGFARHASNDTVLAYFNLDEREHALRLPGGSWQDILGSNIVQMTGGESVLKLPAKTAAVAVRLRNDR